MNYPEDFKKEVKEVYPDFPEIHKLLDNGGDFLGRYLDDSSGTSISIKDILDATNLEDLQERARKMQRKVKLYIKWCQLYDNKNDYDDDHDEENYDPYLGQNTN